MHNARGPCGGRGTGCLAAAQNCRGEPKRRIGSPMHNARSPCGGRGTGCLAARQTHPNLYA
jgi:hypothetical protein